MRIPWKAKSTAFAAIDRFGLSPLLYFAQKYVTKRSRRAIHQAHPHWQFHAANLGKIKTPRVLEFGAGKSLAQNLYLSSVCGEQVLVDLNPMFDPGLADAAAESIARFTSLPYKKIANDHDLGAYHISYQAPLDMASSGFTDNSFDAWISTSTLEHIPEDSLKAILKELRRVLKPGALASLVIDYSDHYAHTDKTIGALEFLRYENYAPYNHRSHFQNRLRHGDFERLFREAGFTIHMAEPCGFAQPPENVASCFDVRAPNIFATEGRFILMNNKS